MRLRNPNKPHCLNICLSQIECSNRCYQECSKRGDTLAQWLDTDDKLESTRRLAHLLHLSRYLQLQQRMWQAYFELGQREGVWAPRKSKSVAKQQNTCSTYGRSEALVKQRQKNDRTSNTTNDE